MTELISFCSRRSKRELQAAFGNVPTAILTLLCILLANQGRAQTPATNQYPRMETLVRFPPLLSFGDIIFSPDGRALATLRREVMLWNVQSKPPALQLWSVPKGELLWTAKEPVMRLIAFSPSSALLLGVTTDFKTVFWDAANGRVKYVLSETNRVGLAAFLPDGETVLTTLNKGYVGGPQLATAGEVQLRQLKTGRLIRSLPGQTDPIGALAVSRDGRILAVANLLNPLVSTARMTVNLLEVPGGALLRTLDFGADVYRIDSLVFSPDGKTLVTGDRVHAGPGEVRFWDVGSGRLQKILTETTPGFSAALGLRLEVGEGPADIGVAFSPSGRTVAVVGLNQCLCMWDVAKGKLVYGLGPDNPPNNSPCAIQFARDGLLLARVVNAQLQIQLDLLHFPN